MNKHISLAALAIVAALTGCTKNPIEALSDSKGLADLELASVNSVQTKAAIDGTTFPTDGEIGLFLFKDEMATQDYGEGYKNVKYAYNSSKSRWTASPSIKVGSTPGYLYGYYPYDSEATDVKAIPVESSLNGDDVMYATKQTVNDKTASQTAITMNHALARVSIAIVNKGYTGDAKLSKIKFSGAEIAQEGNLNALNGTITATRSDDVTLNVTGEAQTITAVGTTYECLLVPSEVETNKQTVTLTLTIDGEDKTATLSGENGVIIAQNTKSNITITLSNTGISVQTVSVEDWNVVEVGGHKVTVNLSDDAADAGIADDLIVQVSSNGSSVIVKTYSDSGKKLVIRNDDATLVTPVEDGKKSTFTISSITSDITATLSYAKQRLIAVNLHTDLMPTAKDYQYGTVAPIMAIEGRPNTLTATPGEFYAFSHFVIKDIKYGNKETLIIPNDVNEIDAYFYFTDWLKGIFSVGNGKKVRFSRGNLWFDSGGLHFESNQYETTTSTPFESYDHYSHFTWCDDIENAIYYTYNNDWNGQKRFFAANNFTVNVFNGWSTLTKDEWEYLFDGRTGNRFAKARVHDMNGLLIFPDGYSLPSNYSEEGGGKGMSKVNPDMEAFPTDNIPDETNNKIWSEMEAAGVVFLPAVGYHICDPKEQPTYGPTGVCWEGYYWSATQYGDDKAYCVYFYNTGIYSFLPCQRYWGSAIRLVTEVK